MIAKKRILITLNQDVVDMMEDLMEKNYVDTSSQMVTRLIVAEHQAMEQRPKRGRPLKDGAVSSKEETSPLEEGMVWWEGDDMNPPRYMTKEEYETRMIGRQN